MKVRGVERARSPARQDPAPQRQNLTSKGLEHEPILKRSKKNSRVYNFNVVDQPVHTMATSSILEQLFKWLFLISALLTLTLYFKKDGLPEPQFYDLNALNEPVQTQINAEPFKTRVNGQEYTITPLFDYELFGVVVSYSDADAFSNIWHHKRWQDFLNLRDLCVIWGKNVGSGVYKQIKFHNDSWTCWASWQDYETGSLFKMNALSNNHLLTDNDRIKKALMSAEPGDHIRFKGVLAEYANKSNNFFRGTSTTREDNGNGACETIYLEEFEILKKANPGVRMLYRLCKWTAILSFFSFLVLFAIAPVRIRH